MRAAVLSITLAGCVSPELLCNPGFDLQCDDGACGWEVVEGEVAFTSWHPAEPGLDLSASDRAVVRQRLDPRDIAGAGIAIEASVARSPDAALRFELEWYGQGPGWDEETAPDCAYASSVYLGDRCGAIAPDDPGCKGDTVWERDPRLLDIHHVPLQESGTFRAQEWVRAPSAPGKDDSAPLGLLFSIVKQGPGLAVIDELSLYEAGR